MIRSRHILNIFFAAILTFASACSEESATLTPDTQNSDIILRIPNLPADRFATRGDKDITGGEGKISELRLVIFKSDDNGSTFSYHKNLDLSTYTSLNAHDNSTEVNITGHLDRDKTYRFYLLANISHYIAGSAADLNSEADINGMTLDFGSGDDYKLKNGVPSDKGLPMACMAGEMRVDGLTVADGKIAIKSNEAKVIHADLTFLCAKLRYTVLFDNTATGFSNSGFGDNDFTLSRVDFSNISDKTRIDPNTTADGLSPFSLTHDFSLCQYPDYPDTYPVIEGADGSEKLEDNNLPIISDLTDDGRHAWQGIIYLPENRKSDEASRTVFSLTGETGEQTFSYSASLLPKLTGYDSQDLIERGHAYDVVARIKSIGELDITFIPAPWTVEQLTYTPGSVFLHLDRTSISLNAGEEKAVGYETNVETLNFESPKYINTAGEEINLYKFSRKKDDPDHFYVRVNPDISVAEFDNLKDADGIKPQYNFFHVLAGNLRKKIDVTPLLLQPFLTVTPNEIDINVREQIASGIYSNYYEMTAETNLKDLIIDQRDWNIAGEDGSTLDLTDILYLKTVRYENNTEIEENVTFDDAGKATINAKDFDGSVVLRLYYSGLNSGKEFWTDDSHTLGLDFSAHEDGITLQVGSILGDGTTLTEEDINVAINTVPSNDDYIIHFKGDGWTNPHIYVYQCLQLPATFSCTLGGYNLASMPVGYTQKDDNFNAWAALEYSFTGKIAFKGWDYPDNAKSLATYSNNYAFRQGFFIFDDGNSWDNPDYISWNAAATQASVQRYYKDWDFCSNQRDNGCQACKTGNNPTFPGIRMKNENNGWWRFNLTGIATPGKALIIFTDGHSGSDLMQYPGKNEVGLPLFDFPSREGWFNYNSDNKNFVSRKTVTNPKTYRIYWYNEYSDILRNTIYFYNCDNVIPTGNYDFTGKDPGDNNQVYFEFKTDVKNFTLNFYIKQSASNSNNEKNWTGFPSSNFNSTSTPNLYKTDTLGF